MRLLPILLFACSDNSVKTTNSSPDIIISSHNNNSSFNDGDIVTFRAEVSDLDESSSNLRTSWYINNTLACDWANANESGTAECPIPMTLGATQINVTVKDSQDAASMTTLNIQVWPAGTLDTGTDTNSPEDTGTTNTTPDNLPPVVFITSPESGETFVENDDIDFKGLTFDYQEVANDLSIEWSSTSIGVFDITNSDSEGNISTQSPLPAGTHQISLTVTDSGGLSTTKTTDIEILSLVLPTVQCQILSPNNGDSVIIGNSGNQFVMEGFVGSSGPISELSYNFSSNVDGWLDSGNINNDGSLGWSGTSLSEASHNFTLDVSYMGQSVCNDTIQVTIEQPVLTITHKNIFVTSQRHDGNFGGITGADTFCQGLATSAGLSGTYLAWLSDTTTSPSARFAQANVPYRLVDGTTIANDWADLVDGSIQNPINLDEYGNAAPVLWSLLLP